VAVGNEKVMATQKVKKYFVVGGRCADPGEAVLENGKCFGPSPLHVDVLET